MTMMHRNGNVNIIMGLVAFLLLAITSCEEAYTPEGQDDIDELVVEGYVEAGEGTLPVYVILSRALPFYAEIGEEEFMNLFVRDAFVEVDDGDKKVQLQQICFQDLDDDLKEILLELFGLEEGGLAEFICIYIDLNDQIIREIGRSYDLRIEAEDKVITSTTEIPDHVPIDTLRWSPTPGEPIDSMLQLLARAADPPGVPNYYRYLTSTNGGPFYAGFGSVAEDSFFDGVEFEFSLDKQVSPYEDVDFETYGFFLKGDTATIKWMNLDLDHFNFWNTLEYARNNQGPFTSYSRVTSNVNGALGIWGGYSVSFYTLVAPED